MSRDDPQMKLRLPPALKERVEAAARVANRSMNAEIVYRLELSFEAGLIKQDLQATAASELRRATEMLQKAAREITEESIREISARTGVQPARRKPRQ